MRALYRLNYGNGQVWDFADRSAVIQAYCRQRAIDVQFHDCYLPDLRIQRYAGDGEWVVDTGAHKEAASKALTWSEIRY